jgi:hypothetical protein
MAKLMITTSDALALRRLLWEMASVPDTRHDLKVEAYHWAALLDDLAGMPPWPTKGEPTQQVVGFYESIVAHLTDQIETLLAGE